MTTVATQRPEDPKSHNPFTATGPSVLEKRSAQKVENTKGDFNPRVRDPLAVPVTQKGITNVR